MKTITKLALAFCFLCSFSSFAGQDLTSYYASSRLDYYTNEETGEILVFVPDKIDGMKVTVDLVFEFEILNRGFAVFPSGVSTVPFSLEKLREGRNEITVSFNENDKWVDSRKIWVEKKSAKDNAVKIDRATGGLVVGGLQVFPFGFTSSFQGDMTISDPDFLKGFNEIGPFRQTGTISLKDRKACMKHYADQGVGVNYDLSGIMAENGKGTSGEKKLEMLRKEIETFRSHPALLTWYLAENPDVTELKPDSLLKAYRLIKELDPYHPVCMSFGSPRNAALYRNVTDISITAPGPVPNGTMMEVKDYTRIPLEAFWLEKPIWIQPQTFGGNQYWDREPTPAELRAMTYMAIISGATGIEYSNTSDGLGPKSAALWDECGALASEIAELTPVLLSPHPAPELIPDHISIQARSWNRAGLVTLIVVNIKNEPLVYKLKMKNVDVTITADVLFENRKVNVTEGILEDIIDGYGTRVYMIDVRQRPDWKKDLQPGNLVKDPGFEDVFNAGVPSACYAISGESKGSSFFVDSRLYFQGDHSLRMNNPSTKPGTVLSFFGIDLSNKKSYTMSIMARTGFSPNRPAGKKDQVVSFSLELVNEKKVFSCTDAWQNYEINGALNTGDPRISPLLKMEGKGTAWFDNLQVYPDMELKEGRGEEGKVIIELFCNHPESKIFYTYDGTEPTMASLPYQVPLECAEGAPVKAAAFAGDIRVGYIER
jgi:hypothetical protein